MKSKIIVVGVVVVVLGGVFMYLQRTAFTDAKPATTSEVSLAAKTAAKREAGAVTSAMPVVPAAEAKSTQAAVLSETEIEAKIDRLKNLQFEDDAASLAEILAELRNPNPKIRHEAIEATCQFQSRSAIPVLEALAAETADPAEKKELLDAAEFLKLPTYTEFMAAKKKAKESAAPAAQ
jgi:type III secretory pathway component EscV